MKLRFGDDVRALHGLFVGAKRAKASLEKEFGFSVPPGEVKQLGTVLGPLYGDNQFDNIIRFMSGRTPGECDENLRKSQPQPES